MSESERSTFEQELFKQLKTLEQIDQSISASKNKLKFKIGKVVVAEIYFAHLRKVDGYYVGGEVYGGPLYQCCMKSEPPYKNNLFNSSILSFTSLSEGDGYFGDVVGGVLKTPEVAVAEKVAFNVRDKLVSRYIPWILNCVFPNVDLVGDVVRNPDFYAYPAIVLKCSAKYDSGINCDSILEENSNNKKIIKNKEYDLNFLKC